VFSGEQKGTFALPFALLGIPLLEALEIHREEDPPRPRRGAGGEDLDHENRKSSLQKGERGGLHCVKAARDPSLCGGIAAIASRNLIPGFRSGLARFSSSLRSMGAGKGISAGY